MEAPAVIWDGTVSLGNLLVILSIVATAGGLYVRVQDIAASLRDLHESFLDHLENHARGHAGGGSRR